MKEWFRYLLLPVSLYLNVEHFKTYILTQWHQDSKVLRITPEYKPILIVVISL